ncbi:MAG: hypothetical protein FJ138_07620 [Deltaproteobacteria bacterium]|nr:hypothetical protein [Deltaproteobacteria bacterium]
MRVFRSLLTASAALAMGAALSLSPAALSLSPAAAQGVSEYTPYQGFLTDAAGAPLTGVVSLTFKLYEASDSAVALWEETIAGVEVVNGAFSVHLGRVTPNMKSYMTDGRAQYLGVAVDGNAVSPRQRLGTQPYAFLAYNASRLNGQPAAFYATVQQLNELTLNAGAGLSEAQVNALIDLRGYLNQAAITNLVNQLIDARGYLNQAAITALVNQLIDARGFVTEAQVNAAISAAVNTINAAIAALQQQVTNLQNTVNAQGQQVTNLQNTVNAQNANITNLQNQVNTLQQSLTALQAQVNNLNVNGTQPEIVGVSGTATGGKIQFGGLNGIRGASASCNATVAGSHVCTLDEATRALALGRVNAAVSGVETWSLGFNPNKGANCQNFLYNSGDVATGTTMTINLNYTSNGGGGGANGYLVDMATNRACATALRVLCCK